jgi:hypothetical protein
LPQSPDIQSPDIQSPPSPDVEIVPPAIEPKQRPAGQGSLYPLPKLPESVLDPMNQPIQAIFDLAPATRPSNQVVRVGFERDFSAAIKRESLTDGAGPNNGTTAPIIDWEPSFRSFGNRFERFGGQR